MLRFAVNPLQFYATALGTLDFANAPPFAEIADSVSLSGFDAIQVDPAAFRSGKACVDYLQSFGLKPAPPYFSGRLSSLQDHGEIAARYLAMLDFAAETGLDCVVVADDMNTARTQSPGRGTGTSTAVIETIAAITSRLADTAAARGVRLCFHPHVGTWIESPDDIEALLKMCADTVFLCPDTGHLAWGGCDDVPGFVRRHASRVAMLHVKDVSLDVLDKSRTAGQGYHDCVRAGLWREPGTGDLNLAAVIDGIRSKSLWCVIEVDAPFRATPVQSLALSASFVHDVNGSHSRKT